MATLTRTLTELIDSTIFHIAGPDDLGVRVVAATGISATDTVLDHLVSNTSIGTSDLLEFGDELLMVTDATDFDALGISRGYYGTTPAAIATNSVGHINPAFPRVRIAEAIKRSFARLEALGAPLVASGTFSREVGLSYIQIPADAREVYQVMYWGSDGRLLELGGWEFYDNLPTAKFSTGKVLNIGRYVADSDELEVVYRTPYRWSSHPNQPVGTDEISLLEGCEDLPSLYAAAWLVSSREVSRTEIDRSDEWARTEQYERGVTQAIARNKWQEFYRALDEARRLNHTPQPLRYKTRPLF